MNKTKEMALLKIESYYADDKAAGLDVKLYNADDIWFLASVDGDEVGTIMVSEDNYTVALDQYSLEEWQDRINDDANSHFKEYTGPVRIREMSKVAKKTEANKANSLIHLLGKF